MNIGERVVVAGPPGWPDIPGTVEETDGIDCLVHLDEKHADGSVFDGWPWCRARACGKCGKMHFIEQLKPDAMSEALERQMVAKLRRGESVAGMWPIKI